MVRHHVLSLGGLIMLFAEIALCILCIVGAVYFGKKKKIALMIGCIAVAAFMAFLFGATMLLLGGID